MISKTSATKLFNDRQKVFLAQFIKGGVEYSLAIQAAQILAAGKPEELLTPEEQELLEQACRLWLEHRNGMNKIQHAIASVSKHVERARLFGSACQSSD